MRFSGHTTKVAKKSKDICLATREWAQVNEEGRQDNFPPGQYLLPEHPNQEPRHFFSIPSVGTSLPHPQAAQWFPERTLGCKIALPAVLLHG